MEGLALAALAFFMLVIFPFAIYPTSLRLLRPAPARTPLPAPSMHGEPGVISLCVCAYNEEAVIEDKVRNMLALRDATPGLELLVYVDGTGDRTAEILRAYTDRLALVVGEVRRGKSFGMNQLVARARGEIIVFSDANVIVERDAVNRLRRRFEDPAVGCVCGHLHYANGAASATAEVNSAYWRLEERIKQRESALGAVMGADGSLFAIRRHLHRQVPDDIIDDFFVSMSILCDGHRVISAPEVRAWENTATDSGDELRRKVRIACQSANVHRLLRPRIRTLPAAQLYMYTGHKLLRWATGANLLAGCLFAFGAIGLWGGATALGGAAGAALVLGLAAWLGIRPAPQLVETAGAMVATSFGVLLSFFGARFTTWRPAASVRGPLTAVPSGGGPPSETQDKAPRAPEDLRKCAG